MSRSFLFAVWAGGGNVPPQLTVARRLAARGHDVRMLAPAVLRTRIEAAGVAYEPYREAPEHDSADPERALARDFDHRSPVGAARAIREGVFIGLARPIAADVLSILERRPIDAVVPDYVLLGGLFAAEKAGVPRAMLVHTIDPFPRPGIPPYGFGWPPAKGVLGAARDAVGRFLFERVWTRPMLPGLNAVRRDLGLPPLASVLDLARSPNQVFVLSSEAFDFPAPVPPNVRHLGAQLEDADSTPPWQSPWPADDARPLVVASFSTTYQKQEALLERTVEALGRLPVRALVTTGGLPLPAVPANVHAEPFVPHAQVLPRADLVVTHGGLGTVLTSLANGVPLVCLPVGRDQPDNAARVAWHGAGVRISSGSSAANIAAAVTRVLGDPAYRSAAATLARAMAAENAPSRGPDALEELAPSSPGDRVRASNEEHGMTAMQPSA